MTIQFQQFVAHIVNMETATSLENAIAIQVGQVLIATFVSNYLAAQTMDIVTNPWNANVIMAGKAIFATFHIAAKDAIIPLATATNRGNAGVILAGRGLIAKRVCLIQAVKGIVRNLGNAFATLVNSENYANWALEKRPLATIIIQRRITRPNLQQRVTQPLQQQVTQLNLQRRFTQPNLQHRFTQITQPNLNRPALHFPIKITNR